MRVINNNGNGVAKVSSREVRIPGVALNKNIDSIQTLLDAFSLSVAAGEVIYLLLTHYNADQSQVILSKFVFKNNHATTVFSPASPIDAENDLIDINTQYTIGNILENESTQLIDLGDLGASDVWDVLNAENPAQDVQDQADGYVVIQTEIDGNAVYYLFLADGGLYGVGELQSVEADFVELSQYVVSGFWQMQTNNELFNLPGIGTINLTAYLRPLLGIELNKVSVFSRITDGGVTAFIRFLADGIFGIKGLLKDIVDFSAEYDAMSYPNWGAVTKLTGKRELSFTLTQLDEQKPDLFKELNNPTLEPLNTVTMERDDMGDYYIEFFLPVFAGFCYPAIDADCSHGHLVMDTSGLLGYIQYYVETDNRIRIRCRDTAGNPTDNLIKKSFVFTIDMYNFIF